MSERKLNALESRKRLLILESELNRALLLRDIQNLKADVADAVEPIKQFSALASTFSLILGAFRSGGWKDLLTSLLSGLGNEKPKFSQERADTFDPVED